MTFSSYSDMEDDLNRASWVKHKPEPSIEPETTPDSPGSGPDAEPGEHTGDGPEPGSEYVRARLGVRPLSSIPDGPPQPLMLDRLDADSHTILFGPGGIGKGTLACAWIIRLTEAGHVVLIVDYEDHPAEWARRIAGLGGITEGIYHVSPSAASWKGARGAIWGQAADLADAADDVEATYVVVDSIVVACGHTDALAPEAPGQYAAALARIGRPTLSLGHVTKAEDVRYPFGSIFWHNLARVTWSLARGHGGAILTNRKANNHPNQGRQLVTMTWMDDRPTEVWERPYSAKLAELVRDVLADGPLTVAEIADRLDAYRDEDEPSVKTDSIRHMLRRGLKADPMTFRIEGTGERATWRNA